MAGRGTYLLLKHKFLKFLNFGFLDPIYLKIIDFGKKRVGVPTYLFLLEKYRKWSPGRILGKGSNFRFLAVGFF